MTDSTSQLKAELRETKGNLKRAARNIGFNYGAALMRFSEVKPTVNLGRPELQKYIIAYRYAFLDWAASDEPKLADARKKFDAGTHEMCQGRDGDIIIQYLIPRLVPCRPRKFFNDDDASI